jgi:hypothetical protein
MVNPETEQVMHDAVEAMEQIRHTHGRTMRAITGQTLQNMRRIVHKEPADPVAFMLTGALADLRQIRTEIDDAIHQIEQVQRECKRRR